MIEKQRESLIIILSDLLLSLFSFWLARYFGDLPRWYWLVLSAVLWCGIGIVSGKLRFGDYKRVRYALLGIASVDVLSGALLYIGYKYFVPGYEYDSSILLASGLILLLECMLYYSIRRLIYRKIPYFYEEPSLEGISEIGLQPTLKLSKEIWNEDLPAIIQAIKNKQQVNEVMACIKSLVSSPHTVLIDSTNQECILSHKTNSPSLVVFLHSLNCVRYLNTFLSYANYCLPDGGYIVCHCVTTTIRKERILRQTPLGINYMILFLDFLWHQCFFRIPWIKSAYYNLSKDKRRLLHRVEVLGKLYRAGFEVAFEEVSHGEFYVVATKKKAPIRTDKPNTGLLIRLRRIGKDGKTIGVYKFRTMYAYSEYLQPYIYKQEGLCKGGKIADDYRITPLGRFLRRTWLDELPMLINWAMGDMKLVGVRPLSDHYFSLYSKELQALRTKVKPGLLPPYYADMPETLEEIQESEKRYLKAYLKQPMATDWRYFRRAFENIVFKGKRSK